MTKEEEIKEFAEAMKEMNVEEVGNLKLLEMFELWAYELSEGYVMERNEVVYYYDKCRQEILKRMAS